MGAIWGIFCMSGVKKQRKTKDTRVRTSLLSLFNPRAILASNAWALRNRLRYCTRSLPGAGTGCGACLEGSFGLAVLVGEFLSIGSPCTDFE